MGNKSDLKEDRVVSFNEAAKFCQENSNLLYVDIQYYECSAYTGDGVDEIFMLSSKNIIQKVEAGVIELEDDRHVSNKVVELNTEEPPRGYCSSC